MSASDTSSSGDRASSVWVFHSGALGDFVLIWPLLRSLARSGHAVTLVARHSHAALACDWLGPLITTRAIEHPDFDGLWRGEMFVCPGSAPSDIVSFVADTSTPAGRTWMDAAARSLRARAVWRPGHPGSSSRCEAWSLFHVEQRGAIALRDNPEGPVVLHVGAGSRAKAWPLERWSALKRWLDDHGARTVVIAGEVELERWGDGERRAFVAMAGRFVPTLDELAGLLSSARLTIACDTGPAHLAAQLGVTTLALFGPTDPKVWMPVGPRVRVTAPHASERTSDMAWLAVEPVVHVARELLTR